MSGYIMDLMKPIKPKTGQEGKKGDFQRRRQSWHTSLMVSVETQDVLDSSHGRVTYETDQRQKGLKKSHQVRPKHAKNVPKGQKSRVSKNTAVLYSSHDRVPLKPIRDNEEHINLRKMHQDFCFSLNIILLAVNGHFVYCWHVLWSPYWLWMVP